MHKATFLWNYSNEKANVYESALHVNEYRIEIDPKKTRLVHAANIVFSVVSEKDE